jgi:DNA polymerase I
MDLWRAWMNRHGITWPCLESGKLNLTLDTFVEMTKTHPEVRPIKELWATLARLRPMDLPVGADGRNRCPLRPFATTTGRNAPRSSQFIFGPAVWLRGLIKPESDKALAYVDYCQQEFGIGAALSRDSAMAAAYHSGDPYLAFAKQAGAVPPDATRETHGDVREQFKHCALGVQYGMQARSLAIRLSVTPQRAQELIDLHKRTYPVYWRWSCEVGKVARKDGRIQAALGWTVHVSNKANHRSLRNFPLQANGAEMLRLACFALTEEGVRVCAPVHDALLVEANIEDIERVVGRCQQAMAWASGQVLRGFTLRADAKIVRYPDRYMDNRGEEMWNRVMGLLDRRLVA